jgi:hypothetical protein
MDQENTAMAGVVLFFAAVPFCLVLACVAFWCCFVRSLHESRALLDNSAVGESAPNGCAYSAVDTATLPCQQIQSEATTVCGVIPTAIAYPLESEPGVRMLAIPVVDLPTRPVRDEHICEC